MHEAGNGGTPGTATGPVGWAGAGPWASNAVVVDPDRAPRRRRLSSLGANATTATTATAAAGGSGGYDSVSSPGGGGRRFLTLKHMGRQDPSKGRGGHGDRHGGEGRAAAPPAPEVASRPPDPLPWPPRCFRRTRGHRGLPASRQLLRPPLSALCYSL